MFGWMVGWPLFRTLTDTTGGSVLIALVHGVVWDAYIVIGIVIPGIVRLLGYDPINVIKGMVPGTDEFSLLSAGGFAFAYAAWGAILGFTYACLQAESEEPEPWGPDGESARTEHRTDRRDRLTVAGVSREGPFRADVFEWFDALSGAGSR